ncbi:Sialic acid transporter NanT [Sodalis praecaptivus]
MWPLGNPQGSAILRSFHRRAQAGNPNHPGVTVNTCAHHRGQDYYVIRLRYRRGARADALTEPSQLGQPHRRLTRLTGAVALYLFTCAWRFFELYDLFETGYISAGLIAANIFHTGSDGVLGFSDQAAFASATFLGLFVGSSLLAPYADRFGRRLSLMCALAWYGCFSLVMAFQNSAEGIILCRFLVGIGLGIELVTIDTYLTEWVPAHLRSRAFAFSFFVQFLSVPTVAIMSWWLIPKTILHLEGWRWVVIAGALCSLVIWFIRKNLPESARWLAQQGRHREAHQVMCAMEKRYGREPGADFPADDVAAQLPKRGRFREIWSPAYRQRTLMLVVMNFFRRSASLALATGCRRCCRAKARPLPTVCCMPFLSPSPIL